MTTIAFYIDDDVKRQADEKIAEWFSPERKTKTKVKAKAKKGAA